MILPMFNQGKKAQNRDMEAQMSTYEILLDALKKIREIGYNSQAARATDTVLACIRVAEDAILCAERPACNVPKPDCITSWVWLHHSFADLPHWQNCLFASVNAGAFDPINSAREMYLAQGGAMIDSNPRRRKSRA